MKAKFNKGLCKNAIVSICSIACILLAVCLCGNTLSEVHAASALDTATYAGYAFATYTGEEALEYVGKKAPTQEGYVFAGWFTNSKCRKDDAITSKTQIENNGTYYAKFVLEDVLTVKAQLSEKDVNASTPEDERNMRFVSSVDSTNYQSVGFRLKYREGNEGNDWVYKKNTATTVFKRITSYVEGDEYKYSSKVVDTKSEYFMTAIWKGSNNTGIDVATAEVELNCYVRAYWVTCDGVTVYGPTRYLSAKDGLSDNIVNISVKDAEGKWAEDATLKASYTNNQDELQNNLSTELYHDGTYAHLKIDLGAVNQAEVLRSVTNFTITDGTTKKEALYRNLFTKYSGSGSEDRTWYDLYNAEDDFVVATAADLYGLAKIVMKNDDVFTDKKIYMVSDITVNKGTAAITGWTPDEGEEQYPWVKIGTYDYPFDGVFDGQGHTIEGVTLVTDVVCNGLFGRTTAKATLKNFRLKNSYLEYNGTTNARFGGVVGLGAGTFENIKSEAFIVSSHINNGGILGKAEGKTTITGCWYSGTMSLNNANAKNSGGIVGIIEGDSEVTIKQCLYDGEITGEAEGTEGYGGLCGNLYGDSELKIQDCFVIGSVASAGDNFIGAIAGHVDGSSDSSITATLRVDNTYIREDICKRAIRFRRNANIYYEDNAAVSTDILSENYEKRVSLDDITGYTLWYNNYSKVDFDFDNMWCLADSTTPQLRKLADKDKILTTLKGEGTEEKPWIVSEKEELVALADMSQEHNFAGKFVSLGTEKQAGTLTITLNKGDTVDEVKSSNPTNWASIGSSTLPFVGTFNGNGNTISGLYLLTDDSYQGLFGYVEGATIKNFTLKTSYLEYTGNGNVYLGGVVGYGEGTFRSIKSEANIVSGGSRQGGIIGGLNGASTISDCWYSGTMDLTGGYGGGIVGMISDADVSISNCLYTGTIEGEQTGTGARYSGFCGSFYGKGELNITDCMSIGSIIVPSGNWNGTLVGFVQGASATDVAQVTVSNTYSNMIGDNANQFVVRIYTNGNVTCDGVNTVAPGIKSSAYDKYTVSVNDIKGYDAWYSNSVVLGLDFEKSWCLVEGTTPQLRSFTDEADMLPMLDGQGTEACPWLITNAQELKNLSTIAQKLNFAGKFVSIGTEEQAGTLTITLNKGDTVDEVKSSNPTNWASIGSSTLPFVGTFNGNGNTISGLYLLTDDSYQGLFGYVEGATIKNFTLKTSYLEYTGNGNVYLGGVVGYGEGTFRSIKSEANIVSGGSRQGGIIGGLNGASTISDCWYSGTMDLTGGYGGGIVGMISDADVSISNCLYTGTIEGEQTGTGARYSGFCGSFYGKGELNITDCMSIGSIIVPSGNWNGTLVGFVQGASATDVAQVTVSNTYSNMIGDNANQFVVRIYTNGNVTCDGVNTVAPGIKSSAYDKYTVSVNDIKGYDAWYNKLNLDFENHWCLVEGTTPQLRSFTDEADMLPMLDGQGTEASPWIVSSKEEMLIFVDLSQDYNFAGKHVSIGTEEQAGALTIVINEGATVEEVKANAVAEGGTGNWTPIGTSTMPFAGTFNGNGNTISGIYYQGSDACVGLFGCTAETSTIANLNLTNSYFENTLTTATVVGVGSIAGQGYGLFDTIKSDATVVSSAMGNGGIVGAVQTEGSATFTNCWFAGTLSMPGNNGRQSGGIVGLVKVGTGKEVFIQHCLNTGDITAIRKDWAQVGGICGILDEIDTANPDCFQIRDCLNTKHITNEGSTERFGSIIGQVSPKNFEVQLTDVYALNELKEGSGTNAVYYEQPFAGFLNAGSSLKQEDCDTLKSSALTGNNAWYNTTLDFDNYWVAIDGKTPELKALSTSETLVTWSGKGTETSPWIINNGEELTLLSTLSQTYTFENKFIRLGTKADAGKLVISVNEGNSIDEVKANAVAEGGTGNWQPIGRSNYPFSGTFDGNGNTISGLYYQGDGTAIGMFTAVGASATVKDFKLVNSYFESTYVYNGSGNNYTSIGSIAGLGYGTLEGIKSEAEVVCHYTYGGGLVGGTRGYDNLTISDCWFDGTLRVEGEQGAIGGGILGGTRKKNEDTAITIENCLNSGEIRISALNTKVARVGGICGYVDDNMTVTNCLNAKSFVTTRERAAAIIGEAHNGSNITLENIYAITGDIAGINDASGQPYGTYNQNEYCGYIAEATETQIAAEVTLIDGSWAKVLPENLAGENARTSVANLFAEGTHWLVGDLYPVLNIVGEQGASIPVMAVANVASTATRSLTGDGNFVTQVTKATQDEYETYLTSLEDAGFEKYAENNLTNTVSSATYVKKKLILTATYFKNENRTSISYYEGPISEHLKRDESDINATDIVANTSMSMLEMFHYGNSFVIQLKNGHFIVSDGGLNDELIYLVEYLEEMAGKTDGVQNIPVIEAWFISHAHGDHTGAFNSFWDAGKRELVNRVYVEGVYYSSPSDEYVLKECGCESMDFGISKVVNCLLKTEDGKPTPLYRPQTGQRYYFNDTTIDILLAQEQLAFDGSDGVRSNLNSSSTVCLFTSENQTCLLSGDLQEEGFDILFANYDATMFNTLDFFALNHHGFNTSATIARNITAKTILKTVKDVTPVRCKTAIETLCNKAVESVAWGTGTVKFTFPYTPNATTPTYTVSTPNSWSWKDSAEQKYHASSERKEQPNLLKGVDGTTEEEFE